MRELRYKHTYLKRNKYIRIEHGIDGIAEENVGAILSILEEKEKLSNNLSRAKGTIYDLVVCNVFDLFCTFTFSDDKVDRTDFNACKKLITKAFNNYRTRHAPDFRYLIVPELHKKNGWHFHGLIRGIREGDLIVPETIPKRVKGELRQVPNTPGYVDWPYASSRFGFFSCSKIKHYERCAKYITKYITKDLADVGIGRHLFLASKNLHRPEVVEEIEDTGMFFQPEFENEFCAILESSHDYGVLVPWHGECCSDVHDPEGESQELTETDVLYPRLTGNQLKMEG